jgi:uncharacterized oxidoreductase
VFFPLSAVLAVLRISEFDLQICGSAALGLCPFHSYHDLVIVQADKLLRIVREILEAHGARSDEADLVARHLVDSNLTGHDSHGVARLPRYVEDMRAGGINVAAQVKVVRDGPGALVLDGDWCFGQVAATQIFDLLIERAGTQGVAAGGVYNTNDTARLGAYTYAVAQRGYFALMAVNDGGWLPLIAPWGGKTPLFSTNPLSAAAPGTDGPAFCVDMSTCVTAGSRIKLAQMRGESLDPGTIIDAEGRPSTDPGDLFGSPAGSILPLGAPVAGHKGFGLNLIIDMLCGAVAGAGCSGSGDRDAQGIFAIVINVDAFTDRSAFLERAQGLLDSIRSWPKLEGVEDIRIPGEAAERLREKRQREGIDVDEPLWRQIRELAVASEVEVPS